MADAKNIDDILVKSMTGQQDSGIVEQQPEALQSTPEQQDNRNVENTDQDIKSDDHEQESSSSEDVNESSKDVSSEQSSDKATDKINDKTTSKDDKDNSPIDEYGNPIEKPRLYTEEELQQRIRDRLSRGKYAEQQQQPYQPQQPTQQQIKQAQSEGFEVDQNSDQSWEDQLAQFIDRRLEQRQAQQAEQQWRQQEAAKQVEFETKFTSGMEKYSDFHQVVSGKPITDTMMLATRSLENPAAFVYGASKLHPQELERISRIADPYQQASEVGRLHERMVKERRMVTQAAKPITAPKGDVSQKMINQQPSIDQRIHQHAKQRLSRKQ